MTDQQKKWAVWTSVALAIVVVAGFMPWGAVETRPLETVRSAAAELFSRQPVVAAQSAWLGSVRKPFESALGAPVELFGQSSLGEMSVTITVNGYNGNATLAGITVPNWTVLLLAMLTTTLVWLSVTRTWRAPKYLGAAMAGIALLQATLTMIGILAMPDATIGIGILATIAALATMTCTAFVLARTPVTSPAGQPDTTQACRP